MAKDLNEAFVHGLHRIYFVEKFLVQALDKLSGKIDDKGAKEDFRMHKKETQGHVKNIEEIFKLCGLDKKDMTSDVLSTMEKELDSLIKMVSPESKDFFILEAAAKAERLEITMYEGLILASKDLPIDEAGKVTDLLRQNLSEEEMALKKVSAAMKNQVPLLKRKIH